MMVPKRTTRISFSRNISLFILVRPKIMIYSISHCGSLNAYVSKIPLFARDDRASSFLVYNSNGNPFMV